MRTRPIAITELQRSPEEEQRSRMRRYALTMGIRMACVIACLFVTGWWLVIPAVGAIVLPYIAVVFANATDRRRTQSVDRPGGLVVRHPE
ncbi:MAG: DUF3099 domain-containing protein [Pseudolysinimonas sp.]|uniref:DUF3099 domain-containing protein n=1 Tax=Pseudolysinimonas sp. TaxID=2680009 RepID=UPI003263117B